MSGGIGERRSIKVSSTALARYLHLVMGIGITPAQVMETKRELTSHAVADAIARGESRVSLGEFELVLDGYTVVTVLPPRIVESRDRTAGLDRLKRLNSEVPLSAIESDSPGR